ncbi:hypothetical protein [Moraxella catarrhalis]|uniref:hypothetical protein n=2 Tax=Moraxella catarrhalis TaxID=480 RepID=UPI0007E32F95|nr:hypothetical protein [Moraxella catarrhalis]
MAKLTTKMELVMTTDTKKSALREKIEQFDQLSDTMHDAEKKRTLEEQVEYLKGQGIDPSKSYAKWDDDKKEE